MVNRAVEKEDKEVILNGHAFLRLVLSHLGMFVDWSDDQDPLKTTGREICRQRPYHRQQNLASNQGLALEVCVGPKP